jgi:hypothetical protein
MLLENLRHTALGLVLKLFEAPEFQDSREDVEHHPVHMVIAWPVKLRLSLPLSFRGMPHIGLATPRTA